MKRGGEMQITNCELRIANYELFMEKVGIVEIFVNIEWDLQNGEYSVSAFR